MEQKNADELAKWLNIKMQQYNLNQVETGRQTGLSHPTVGAIAKGTAKNPTADTLRKLAAVFDTPEEIVFRIAGLLPEVAPRDINTAEILHLAKQMEPEDQELYAKLGQAMLEKRIKQQAAKEKKKHSPELVPA